MKPRLIITQTMIDQIVSTILSNLSQPQDISIENRGKLLNCKQVASYLGVCERTVKHYIQKGIITGFYLGSIWLTYELILHVDLMNLYCSQNQK